MHNIGLAGSLLNKGKALGAGFMLITSKYPDGLQYGLPRLGLGQYTL